MGKIVVVKRECLPAPCPLIFSLSNMKLNRHCRGQSSNSVHCCIRIAHNCDNNISSLHFVVQRGEFRIFHSVFYLPRIFMMTSYRSASKLDRRLESIEPVAVVVGFQFLFNSEFSRPRYLYCLSSAHNREIIKETFFIPQFKCMSFICSITDSVLNGQCHPI